MSKINLAIENYCEVEFVGTNKSPDTPFLAGGTFPLRNGYSVEHTVNYKEKVDSPDGLENCYKVKHHNMISYFTHIMMQHTYINNMELNKYHVSLDDVIDRNESFLFLIEGGDYVALDLHCELSDTILRQIKLGKCTILLNTSNEPYTLEHPNFKVRLERFVLKYNLNKSNLKILTGNLRINELPETDYDFIPYCYFLDDPWFVETHVTMFEGYPDQRMACINDNTRNMRHKFMDINKTITKFDKKILCYNRRAHTPRRYLFYKMYNNPIINENIHISLNNEDGPQGNVIYEHELGTTSELSRKINEFYLNHKGNWVFDGEDLNVNLATQFDDEFHKKTFVSLVSETTVHREVLFFSEKIFKPIYACQPFILSGNPDSLAKLKEMGFKTFDKWWDESYDTVLKYTDRVDKIEKILVDLCLKSDEELASMLRDMEDVLLHNYNLFRESNIRHLIDKLSNISTKTTRLI